MAHNVIQAAIHHYSIQLQRVQDLPQLQSQIKPQLQPQEATRNHQPQKLTRNHQLQKLARNNQPQKPSRNTQLRPQKFARNNQPQNPNRKFQLKQKPAARRSTQPHRRVIQNPRNAQLKGKKLLHPRNTNKK